MSNGASRSPITLTANCPLLHFPQTEHSIFYASLYSVASDRARHTVEISYEERLFHDTSNVQIYHGRTASFVYSESFTSFFTFFWSHVKCENNIFYYVENCLMLFGTAKVFLCAFAMVFVADEPFNRTNCRFTMQMKNTHF